MDQILTLLLTYKYFILFPLGIVEGPIVTVIAGFFASLGLMNAGIVYAIVVIGDVLGDSIAYLVGRFSGKSLIKYSAFFHVTTEKLDQAKKFFENHHNKALVISKVFHGIGIVGLLAAGVLRIPWLRYAGICLLISLIQSGILLAVGIVFGHLYIQIGKYLDYFAASVSIIGLTLLIIFALYKTKTISVLGK